MPSFSSKSNERLDTCHEMLQALFGLVIVQYDCSVLCGYRGELDQHHAFVTGHSSVDWPKSKHNTSPSLAIDVAPYIEGRGIPWPQHPTKWEYATQRDNYIKDLAQFYHFAGYVLGKAEEHDIRLRWGGDWDKDHDLRDNKFDDLVHFELILGD